MTLRTAIVSGLVLLALASPVLAQPAVTSLAGRVADTQGAVLTGATITIRHAATGASWTATSGADGRFTIPALPPGKYEISVLRDGFAPWGQNDLDLLVGQSPAVEIRLALAAVKDVVSVVDARAQTTASADVITAERIDALPLNGRNFLELALLVPGNQATPTFDPTKTNSVLIGSTGQLGRGGNITIDGQDTNDDVVGGPLLNLPIDAVQEFQIATNRFGADLGRSASSVFNVVTRSGGNTMHGTASIFAREDGWQALPATVDDATESTPFDRQQISGSFSGPLLRDRLFAFGAGEIRNQDGAIVVGSRNTATRTIDQGFATAPLDDRLWLVRLDTGGTRHRISGRYAGQWASDTAASSLERAIGSASQRQDGLNRYNSVFGSWTSTPSHTFVNGLNVGVITFLNRTVPVVEAPQLTFPSLQDGASFRMPQETRQTRFEISDNVTMIRGAHTLRAGGAFQRIDGEFRLGVFQQGRVELIQDFPSFDHTGDGRIDDNDLLFAVTLRSGKPDQPLLIPDADNMHIAGFAQDDWTVSNRLQLSLGLRYEVDTDVNNISHVDDLNPLVAPFIDGERKRDLNNLAPRAGVAWTLNDRTVVRGGYGIYYDRVVLQIVSLERGLDGRALPIEVRAGNTFFVDPDTGQLPPFAPTLANPFTGFVLPGAGASGIMIIDSHLQNPMVHEFQLGFETDVWQTRIRVDGIHNVGRDFIIGRAVGEVFNPVVGGPDRVVNIESSARTKYDAVLVNANRRFGATSVNLAYTLAKAFNYANDDQIPFLNGPIDPNNLYREQAAPPHDRRHKFTATVQGSLPAGFFVSGLWTLSSGVPMDIMMPDGQTRIPVIQRNAGGRQFTSAGELNAFITQLNASGGVDGTPLPLVSEDARFSDSFRSLDIRISRPIALGGRVRVEPMLELFNVFNTTNILGTTNVNYSGFANVLVRDSDNPSSSGYLRSSSFGQPVTTAGGVFGSGGPRAMQLSARLTF